MRHGLGDGFGRTTLCFPLFDSGGHNTRSQWQAAPTDCCGTRSGSGIRNISELFLKHICHSLSKLPTCPGWDAFRKLEADCFESAASVAAARKACQKPKVLILPVAFLLFAVGTSLVASLQGKILACGGGIIETARAMDIMRCHNPASWSC